MAESLAGWIAAHPPADGAFTQTIAGVAERVRAGDTLAVAIRELLDEAALLPDDRLRQRLLASEPAPTGDRRADAYLGALAEHLALSWGVDRPAWSTAPGRFLDTFWFPSPTPGFRAIALRDSPAAFRRRGIFLGPGALSRC